MPGLSTARNGAIQLHWRAAEPNLAPMDAVAAALAAAGPHLAQFGEPLRQRQAIIAASADLQERELIKLSSLTAAIAEALRGRGARLRRQFAFATLASLAGAGFMIDRIRSEVGWWQTGGGVLLALAGVYSVISNYRSLTEDGRKDAARRLTEGLNVTSRHSADQRCQARRSLENPALLIGTGLLPRRSGLPTVRPQRRSRVIGAAKAQPISRS